MTRQEFNNQRDPKTEETGDTTSNSNPNSKAESDSDLKSEPTTEKGTISTGTESKVTDQMEEGEISEEDPTDNIPSDQDVDRPNFDVPIDIDELDVVKEIRRFADVIDEPPTRDLVIGYGRYPVDEYRTTFESWDAALEAAGLDPAEMPDWSARSITNVEILDGLRAVAEKLGHAPTTTEAGKHVNFSPGLASLRFGSWSDALETAGLEASERPSVQDSGTTNRADNRNTDNSVTVDDDNENPKEKDPIHNVIEETLEDMMSSNGNDDLI